jgi:hypothetical protein
MQLSYKSELKLWSLFLAVIIIAVFVHELGHCTVAWYNGIKAIPTPAKAYYPGGVPPDLSNVISLGGVIGTVVASLFAIALFVFSKFNLKSVVLAAALVSPGVYTIMFLLKGRGHDSTEFQEAQAAMGASYSGHSVDWLFIFLLVIGGAIGFMQRKPNQKIIARIIIGVVVSFVFLVVLQNINNKIFDPLFG